MLINIRVQGEPDTQPFTQTFQYEKSDENIFAESAKRIKDRIAKNLLININETLTLYTEFIVTSLKENKSTSEIKEHISKLLSPHQVMIGVPEMLRKLDFEVDLDGTREVISIGTPIPTSDYIFGVL